MIPACERDRDRRGLLLGLACAAATFVMALQPVRSPDVWHHAGAGRFVVENGGPARTDPFSCTAQGRRWIQYEWLAQYLIYQAARFSGVTGLALFRAAGAALASLLLYLAARARGAAAEAACTAVALAMCAGSGRFFSRPEVFTLVILSAWILATERMLRGKTWHFAVAPLLMVPWVNMHGAWVAGLAWLGLTCGGESLCAIAAHLADATTGPLARPAKDTKDGVIRNVVRQFFSFVAVLCGPGALGEKKGTDVTARVLAAFWLSFLIALAATFANPYGAHIWEVPFKLSATPEVRLRIAEWKRPDLDFWLDPRHAGMWVFLAVLAVTWRTMRLRDWLVVLFFGVLSLTARRHIQLAMLVTAPLVAQQFTTLGARVRVGEWRAFRREWTRGATAVAVCLAAVVTALGGPALPRAGLGMKKEVYPVGAGNFLAKNGLKGNLFNSYTFGNYLLWRLHPHNPVFIDGRIDMYGGEIARLYEGVWSAAPGWEKALADHGIEIAVIEISREEKIPILDALHGRKDWALVYWDNISAVYVKDAPGRAAFLSDAWRYTVRPDKVDYDLLQSDPQTAMRDYARKIEEDPDTLVALKGLAEMEIRRGAQGPAVDYMRRALTARPDSADTACNLALTLIEMKQYAEAERLLKKTLSLGEYQAQAWAGLGRIAHEKGEIKKALRAFRRAARHDPENWRRWWNVALVAEKAGDSAAAVAALEEVLRLDPDNQAAQHKLQALRRPGGVRP